MNSPKKSLPLKDDYNTIKQETVTSSPTKNLPQR
jgi:hypothetical protein